MYMCVYMYMYVIHTRILPVAYCLLLCRRRGAWGRPQGLGRGMRLVGEGGIYIYI